MISKRLQQLNPYKPGEQPDDRQYIKLNANENPYPASPKVIKAVRAVTADKLALYPDPDSVDLKKAIARMLTENRGLLAPADDQPELPFSITDDMIFCGNGSDEVLSFVFYAFFDDDKPVVIPEHTYSFYPVYAGYYQIPLKKVPLNADFSINKERMLAEDASGIVLANPNAPIASSLSTAEIKQMLDAYPKDKVFVVDEAYADFSGHTVLPLLAEYKNLLVVRTFSKSMSFAGMRLGYAVGNPELIKALTTAKNSFNHFPVDRICQAAGIASCQNFDWYKKNCQKIMATRDFFQSELQKAGWTVLPSQTNFVLAGKPGRTGKEVYEAIKKEGILVRYFDIDTIRDYVRISIGTDKQMKQLLDIMKQL